MFKNSSDKRQRRLIDILVAERKKKKIPQHKLAASMRKRKIKATQAMITRIESGERAVSVLEYLALADIIGFDPYKALANIHDVKRFPPYSE